MIAAETRSRYITLWERYVTGPGLTLTLAVLLLLSVTYPIQRANWVPGLLPTYLTALVSAAFTALLVQARVSGWRILVWSTVAGAVWVIVAGSMLIKDQLGLYQIADLFIELHGWVGAWSTTEVRSGVVEFGMFLTAVSWLLGYLAVWMALRLHQAWAAVVLGGLTLTIAISNAAGNRVLWLGLFMVAGVLILIHAAIGRRMVGWRAKRLVFDPSTVLLQSLIVLVAGAVIILAVSVLPTPRVAPFAAISRSMDGVMRSASNEFSRLFNGLPSRRHVTTITFDPTTHFTGNPHLTTDQLFTVSGPQQDYWRARTYTTYTSTGWSSGTATWGAFDEGGATYDARVQAQYTFTVSAATDTFFSVGLPARFSQPVESLQLPGMPDDALQVRFTQGREYFPTRTNVQYTSVGNRSIASAAELRSASQQYPTDILRTYTQLPLTFPFRDRQLAASLVQGADNPYDAAVAIQNYLKTLPYNLNIAAPPKGVDGVDYFLFDIRQGYCDYFASAMTVLLRAVGIPARYVLGYTSGTYDPNNKVWDVIERNYHAWTEAYFPGYGWVRFEPTPSNAIEFGGQSSPITTTGPIVGVNTGGNPLPQDQGDTGGTGTVSRSSSPWVADIGRALIALAVVLAAGIGFLYYRWWWRLSRFSKADEVYAKLSKLATLLGVPPDPSATPAEFAAALSGAVPEYASSFGTIANVYAARRYAGRNVSMADLRRTQEAWDSVRWPLVRRLFRVWAT